MQDYTAFETAEVVSHLPLFHLFSFSLSFYNDFFIAPQVIARVWNLIRQHTHLFHWLEAAETIRAYVAHNMDGNKDLLASLETTKNKVATAWKLDEGVGLLKKVEEENEAV